MAEVECFALRIKTEECVRRRQELVYDTKRSKGFVGINMDPSGLWQFLIFRTRADRDKALEDFKGIYMTVAKEHRSLYLDEKYLDPNYKNPPIEELYGPDDEFSKMIKEVQSAMRADIQAEYDKKVVDYENEAQRLKAEATKLKNEVESLKVQIHEKCISADHERQRWEREKNELNKTINSLEAEIRRMLRCIEKQV